MNKETRYTAEDALKNFRSQGLELDDLKCSGGDDDDDDDDDDEIARNLRIGDVHEPDNDTDLETVET